MTDRVVGQIAVQIGPYNLFGYRRCEKVCFVLEEQNQISKCADTRANYKHLSVLSSDLPLGLCEYPVSDALMGLYCPQSQAEIRFCN